MDGREIGEGGEEKQMELRLKPLLCHPLQINALFAFY